jgi:hypothetical protein
LKFERNSLHVVKEYKTIRDVFSNITESQRKPIIHFFLSAATLVAADYGFTCPPRFMSVGVGGGGTDGNCNFSAVRSPIELKLGGDLGLVSQISFCFKI